MQEGMARVRISDAMKHMGLQSREAFYAWCGEVDVYIFKYENGRNLYVVSGDFYAAADAQEIRLIKEKHGANWKQYYRLWQDVLPFLLQKEVKQSSGRYEPVNREAKEFLNEIKNNGN